MSSLVRKSKVRIKEQRSIGTDCAISTQHTRVLVLNKDVSFAEGYLELRYRDTSQRNGCRDSDQAGLNWSDFALLQKYVKHGCVKFSIAGAMPQSPSGLMRIKYLRSDKSLGLVHL